MKRVFLAILLIAPVLLAGCVVTPAYRYSGGDGGYYYSQPYSGSTVVYGSAGASWYPYDGYYQGPWVSYPQTRVYVHDGDRYRGHDRYRDHDRYRHADGDGHSRRFANRFRQTVQQHYGDRGQRPRLARPQSQSARPSGHVSRSRPAPRRHEPSHNKNWRHFSH